MTPLTEAQNRLIHAYVEPGGHWHEGIKHSDGTVSVYRCSCMEHQSIDPIWRLNPTYTDDAPFSNFLRVLFGEEKMYRRFEGWLFHEKYKQDHVDRIGIVDTRLFVPYFFHPDHRERFLTLFLEFLALPETQRDFGWERCKQGIWEGGACYNRGCDRWGECTGKVPRRG